MHETAAVEVHDQTGRRLLVAVDADRDALDVVVADARDLARRPAVDESPRASSSSSGRASPRTALAAPGPPPNHSTTHGSSTPSSGTGSGCDVTCYPLARGDDEDDEAERTHHGRPLRPATTGPDRTRWCHTCGTNSQRGPWPEGRSVGCAERSGEWLTSTRSTSSPTSRSARGPVPVLRAPALAVPGARRAPSRRAWRSPGARRPPTIYRDLDDVLLLQLRDRPVRQFPVPLEGDDVSEIIDRYRDQLPMNEHMVTMDPPDHTRERALLMRLITPKRLKQNEAFMWRLADRQLDEFAAGGRCEFIARYSQPFAMLVVADLLGVPESDHQRFREGFGLTHRPASSVTSSESRDERARVARRVLRLVHRGPSAGASHRRAHRSRPRQLPGRLHARRDRRSCGPRPSCSRPVRRPRPACSPPPSSTSPSTRSSRTSSAPTASASPTSSRRRCASRAR